MARSIRIQTRPHVGRPACGLAFESASIQSSKSPSREPPSREPSGLQAHMSARVNAAYPYTRPQVGTSARRHACMRGIDFPSAGPGPGHQKATAMIPRMTISKTMSTSAPRKTALRSGVRRMISPWLTSCAEWVFRSRFSSGLFGAMISLMPPCRARPAPHDGATMCWEGRRGSRTPLYGQDDVPNDHSEAPAPALPGRLAL